MIHFPDLTFFNAEQVQHLFRRREEQATLEACASSIIFDSSKRFRKSPIPRLRWNQPYLRRLSIDENSFVSEYGVTPKGFDLLLQMLQPRLEVDMRQAARSNPYSAPITAESRLASCLLELRGGRRLEAMRTHGLARSTVDRNFHTVIRAINDHPALKIECDMSIEAQKSRAQEFQKLSTQGFFKYTTGAVDGLALATRTPSKKKYMNQSQFHSGSKKKSCVNLQAICDAKTKFLAVSCQHTGCTNDNEAFATSSLYALANIHQFPYNFIGDNAYSLSQVLMIPYPAVNHITHPERESFNFYHSQVRITIERTFGIFVRRFGIFCRPNQFDLEFFFEVVHAACRLHNFCIDNNIDVIERHDTSNHNAEIDSNGVLINPEWTDLPRRTSDSSGLSTGNVLRDYLTGQIDESLLIVRSHHQS
jgi:hypothetical protein